MSWVVIHMYIDICGWYTLAMKKLWVNICYNCTMDTWMLNEIAYPIVWDMYAKWVKLAYLYVGVGILDMNMWYMYV